MLRPLLRSLLCGAMICAALSVAVAQDKDQDPEDYRRLFKKPETVMEFWNALQFELDVGRPDLAARHLRGLLFKKPSHADLLALIDKDGTIPILRLRNIREWSPDKKVQALAVKDVEELIALATAAQKKRLADPVRIRRFIEMLSQTPEERRYAQHELYKSGAAAVPVMVDSLLKAKEAADRLHLLQALAQMGAPSTEPLIAALDCNDAPTKVDILEILRRRHARSSDQILPFLWYLAASPSEPEAVRVKATEVLVDFLNVPASRLTPAKLALTRTAERYYNHQVNLGDPASVTVWRWDGKQVVQGWPPAATVPASQAEEYYSLRFARQALNLDPAYRPAQVLMLSTALDKAMERGGLVAPLGSMAPTVADLLAMSNPELVIEVLDRALKEKRTGVILAAVRSLGERAETRAKRPVGPGEPPLVQALYYPDPRVQLAAVESLLNIPGEPAPHTMARIVEILARALTPMAALSSGRKVLVAISDEEWRVQVRQAVLNAGAEPILVGTGREALRTLRARGDIDIVLMDSALPMPGLASLLAQLRADVDVGRIPILLAAVPETRVSHDAAARYRILKKRLASLTDQTTSYRSTARQIDQKEAAEMNDLDKSKFASIDERETATKILRQKYEARRKQSLKDDPAGSSLSKDLAPLAVQMADLARRYDLESQVRESALSRFTKPYPNIQVVHTSLLTDPKALTTNLTATVREAGVALTAAEQGDSAERAIRLLAALAQGKPAGYDLKPATATVLETLHAGRLTPEGQTAAVTICGRLPGAGAQTELATLILDGARPMPVRIAAATALVDNIQRFSIHLTEAQFAPLRDLSTQPGLNAPLKEKLDVLLGSLRPGARTTGVQLREYKPAPAAALPPK